MVHPQFLNFVDKTQNNNKNYVKGTYMNVVNLEFCVSKVANCQETR